MHIKILDPLKF